MTYGFCDLCLNVDFNDGKKSSRDLLQRLYEMGYSTVAINRTIDDSVFDYSEKKLKKKSGDTESLNLAVPQPENIDDIVSEFKGKLRILNRITFLCSDPTKTHTLNQSLNLKRYDIYAFVPRTQAAFQYACSQLNVDIIFIDKDSNGIKLTRKLYLQAVDRGIHFEIQYDGVIDYSKRKFSIHYSHLFHMFGKSKNVVISSGASKAIQIRSPYDVINLAAILGLNETKAKASILYQSRKLILKAEGRRCGKSVFKIRIKESGDEESDCNLEAEKEDDDDFKHRKKIKI